MPTAPKKPRRKPRKRFQCTTVLAGQEKTFPILAASAQQVREHYTKRGYQVKSVVLLNTANMRALNGGGWKLSNAYWRKALDHLDLKLPVVVQQMGRVGNTNANYQLLHRSEAPRGVRVPVGTTLFHLLKAKSYHTAEQASESLWHELTHAWQAEQAMSADYGTPSEWDRNAWERLTKRQRKNFSYDDRPIEREARRNAAAMNAMFKLTLPNRG